jgi:hypothetical protein
LKFLQLNALLTSGIGGAIFIIGFLLSGILADYKEPSGSQRKSAPPWKQSTETSPALRRRSRNSIWASADEFSSTSSVF